MKKIYYVISAMLGISFYLWMWALSWTVGFGEPPEGNTEAWKYIGYSAVFFQLFALNIIMIYNGMRPIPVTLPQQKRRHSFLTD